jgi:hypothetical protein
VAVAVTAGSVVAVASGRGSTTNTGALADNVLCATEYVPVVESDLIVSTTQSFDKSKYK